MTLLRKHRAVQDAAILSLVEDRLLTDDDGDDDDDIDMTELESGARRPAHGTVRTDSDSRGDAK